MTGVALRLAAVTVASLLIAGEAVALSFDERWKSIYGSEVSGDTVSAKAEMQPRAEPVRRAERPQARQKRASRTRHKGGRTWHRVSRKSGRG